MDTHGFASNIAERVYFVSAWMERYSKQVNVILVDWAWHANYAKSYIWYDWSAKNSIDVGSYVGRCMAQLSVEKNIKEDDIHMVGHSLGAHVMGSAGRTFKQKHPSGEAVGRITGLDPAGPRFIKGMLLPPISVLNFNRLNKNDADFVDIIHSNGGFEPCYVCFKRRLGNLYQIGHMDFYAGQDELKEAGQFQIGCHDASCSHWRAEGYFLHSIRERNLFG
jgi:lipoprotein lipase